MEDGFFMRMNLKMTPKWAWPGSPDQFRNFGTPHNWQNIKGELQIHYQ